MKIFIIIIVLLISYYLYYENTTLKVTKHKLSNNKINNNIKVAHISDFHNTKSKRLKKALINKLRSNKPDIIVITGDFIDSRRTNLDISLDFLDKIKSICPIYYVSGNHEARRDEYHLLKQGLINAKVKVLENEKIKLNDNINILGIVDPLFKKGVKSKITIDKEIKSIKYDKNSFNILLTHRPEHFNTYVKYNIDLVFAGHAHGGQIRLPFIGPLFAPAQGFFPKYTANLYSEGNTTMAVSRGIGASLFPFRINNRPELIIVTLSNKI